MHLSTASRSIPRLIWKLLPNTEARELRKISGESLWSMGIFGISMPGTDIAARPMLGFGWSFERPSFAAVTDISVQDTGRSRSI